MILSTFLFLFSFSLAIRVIAEKNDTCGENVEGEATECDYGGALQFVPLDPFCRRMIFPTRLGYSRALEKYTRALIRDYRDAEARYFRAMVFAYYGHYKAATADLEKLAEIDPSFCPKYGVSFQLYELRWARLKAEGRDLEAMRVGALYVRDKIIKDSKCKLNP